MTDPVRAWAAVAPDGTFSPNAAFATRKEAEEAMVWKVFLPSDGGYFNARDRAYRAGWRVVPVEIRVKEEQDG